jgi:hypothetical protein
MIKKFKELNESTQYEIDTIQRLINEISNAYRLGINVKSYMGQVHIFIDDKSVFSTSGGQTYANIIVYLSGLKQGLAIKK